MLLVMSGCAPLSIYYKPGASVARMNDDTLACQVEALKQAPVANQTRQDPPIYYPGRQYCNSNGCYRTAGYWIPGRVYTVDTNLGLRTKLEQNCMAKRGYAPLSLPVCPSNVSSKVEPGATRTLPQISDNSCAIKNDDGTFQIVNRG